MSKYGVSSGPYFPVFGLNTGKDGSEITPYLDTFHAVNIKLILSKGQSTHRKKKHTHIQGIQLLRLHLEGRWGSPSTCERMQTIVIRCFVGFIKITVLLKISSKELYLDRA